tara:strand:+ start:1769 stop:4027 length:2259 start_codon:yes stop_codon:yes gene_type:complete
VTAPLLETQFGWQPLLGGAAQVAALSVLLVAYALFWRSLVGLTGARKIVLLSLRGASLLLVAALLFGPALVHSEGQPRQQSLAVIVDDSRSMGVRDQGPQSRGEAAANWRRERAIELEELAGDDQLRFFLLREGELVPWDGAVPVSSAGASTDLGTGLFSLPAVLDGQLPAGVLLISDGADRGPMARAMEHGGSVAVEKLAAELGFPVSVWSLGSAAGPGDVFVQLEAPPFGFVRRPLELKVRLRVEELEGLPLELVLREDGQIVASRNLSAVLGETVHSFEVKPDQVGFRSYRAEVVAPPGDSVAENNAAEVTVKVIRDRTRVLQVTSRPSWDVKFLRRLLKTDPNIDLVSFFILRNADRGGPLARSGGLSLIAFPYDELFSQDLEGFDLVIFQDFWFGSFTHLPPDRFLENLAAYVQEGGAFLMIGGDTSFGAGDYAGSALESILPTRLSDAALLQGDFKAYLTEAGRRHPAARVHPDFVVHEDRWQGAASLGTRNPLGALQSGALPLLAAGAGGPLLAAVRNVGRGRSMAFASDDSWRWGMGSSGEQSAALYPSFWRGAVRWLVRDAQEEQLQVLFDRENYRLGDEVQLQVRSLRDDYSPRVGAEVHVELGGLSGEPWKNTIVGTDSGGQVTVSGVAEGSGVMVARAWLATDAGKLAAVEARASVELRSEELLELAARPQLLAALAKGSGGRVLVGDDPDPRETARRAATSLLALQRRVVPLWDRWWLLLILVATLSAEWVLRRRLGLR